MTEKTLERKWYNSPAYAVVGFELIFLASTGYIGYAISQDVMERSRAEREYQEQEYRCHRIIDELAKKAERGEKITRYGIERLLQQKNCGGSEE